THTENRGRQNSKILVTMWSFQCFPGDQYLANASEGKYGSTMFNSPEELFEGEIGESFIPGKALEGPHGDKNFTVLSSPVFSMGNFVITNENENPAATVRWMDYFY